MEIWQKTIAVISTFALLFNSIAAPLTVLAQEATPEPTPEAMDSASLTTSPSAQPDATPTVTPTVTPDVTPAETATPTPEATDSTPSIDSGLSSLTASPEAQPTATPDATPTVTPEITPTPSPSPWTFEKVELNKEYQASGVTLTFTKLPSPAGNIKIEEITLTEDQIKQTGSLSDKAYDITSDMADGSFNYNLSLPIPELSKGKTVGVKFAEELSNIGTAEKVENTLTKTDTSVSVSSLDHFTIFVVSGTISGTTASSFNESSANLLVNEFVYNPSPGNEWVELYNTTGISVDLTGWTLVDEANNIKTLSGTVPAHGFYVYENGAAWLNNTDSNGNGDSIYLKNGSTPIDEVTYQKNGAGVITGGQDIGDVSAGQSIARTADGGATWAIVSSPTKGWNNALAAPTTVYVDAATSGVETGAQNQPFNTLQEGINAIASGGTVNVAAGTYTENITVNKNLTLMGAGSGDNPVSDTIINGAVEATGADVTIQALKITNTNEHDGGVKDFGVKVTAGKALTLEAVTIAVSHDAVSMRSVSPTDVTTITINNSNIKGYAAIELYDPANSRTDTNENVNITVNSTSLTGTTSYGGGSNDFSTIGSDYVDDVHINFTGASSVANEYTGGATSKERLIWFYYAGGGSVTGTFTPTNHASSTVNADALFMSSVGYTNTVAGQVVARYVTDSTEFETALAESAITPIVVGNEYGAFGTTKNNTLNAGATLRIEANSPVTINSGHTLTNNGTIILETGATLTNNGTLQSASITGTAMYGQSLTATITGLTGAGTPTQYQWKRGGVDIDGATASTYTLVSTDVGTVITVAAKTDGIAGAGFITSVGTGVVAAPSTVYVDASKSDSNNGLTAENAKKTIQAGINLVNAGGTVNVADGTYNLTSRIDVNKAVSIIGNITTPSNVEINAPDAGGTQHGQNSVFMITSSDVTIRGFKIQGALHTGLAQNAGIYVDDPMLLSHPGLSNITISNNEVTDNGYGVVVQNIKNSTISNNKVYGSKKVVGKESESGVGIVVFGRAEDPNYTHTLTIDNNQVYSNETEGIRVDVESNEGGTTFVNDLAIGITNNKVYNNGSTISGVDKYVGIKSAGWSKGVTVSGNEIYGHTGATISATSGNAGIWIAASNGWVVNNNNIHDNLNGIFFAYSTVDSGSGGHTIAGNDIHANVRGISIDDGTEAVANNKNSIYSNNSTAFSEIGFAPYGVYNSGSGTFDATNNWWGDATGPLNATTNPSGLGNAVSDFVTFNPWYINAGKTTLSDSITVTFDKNGGTTEADPTTRTANYNTTVTLPTAPTKTGYAFDSWKTTADGSGTTFDASTAVTDDITIYAKWTDLTAPAIPTATPIAGDYDLNQSVTLASSDSGSGLKNIYYTTDGSSPDTSGTRVSYPLNNSAPINVNHDMTIKAIAYDNADNASSVLTAVYGIAPVISGETSSSVTSSSTTITWTTDDLSTSRVIYGTAPVSDATVATFPDGSNYGYANSTVEDSAKVTDHSVGLTGLTAGTTYYYRTVSHGSPEAVSDEKTFTTTSTTTTTNNDSAGAGDGLGCAVHDCSVHPSALLAQVLGTGTNTWPKLAYAENGNTETVVLGASTDQQNPEPTSSPTLSPEATTEPVITNPGFFKWILTHKKISGGVSLLLLLIAYGLYRASRKNK